MAFGFPPKHTESVKIENTDATKSIVLAIEVAKTLGWNIGQISKTGFVAFTKFSMTSWGEEILFKIEDDQINIISECTGSQLWDWGKNKKNVNSFVTEFRETQEKWTAEEISSKYTEIMVVNAIEATEGISAKKPKMSGFLSLFQATEGYYVTPILIGINVLLYMIMVMLGVHFFEPDTDSLILWGANYRPVTLDNQWWRLISSCFIHIGIFHLLMNMYALIYIGILLEPYLGKARFFWAYILTGIAGSSASLYWHDTTVSAGASGAIFGMYGVFLAMLTTNLIERSARNTILTSILFFVGYNLLNGLKGGIDNAAHIGGLISGIFIGYAFIPSLKKPNVSFLKASILITVAAIVLASSYLVLTNTSNDIGEYDKKMQSFDLLQAKALKVYDMPKESVKEDYLREIKENGITSWQECIVLLHQADSLQIPTTLHDRNKLLIEYATLRLESFEILQKTFLDDNEENQFQLKEYNKKIEAVIDQLSVDK